MNAALRVWLDQEEGFPPLQHIEGEQPKTRGQRIAALIRINGGPMPQGFGACKGGGVYGRIGLFSFEEALELCFGSAFLEGVSLIDRPSAEEVIQEMNKIWKDRAEAKPRIIAPTGLVIP